MSRERVIIKEVPAYHGADAMGDTSTVDMQTSVIGGSAPVIPPTMTTQPAPTPTTVPMANNTPIGSMTLSQAGKSAMQSNHLTWLAIGVIGGVILAKFM